MTTLLRTSLIATLFAVAVLLVTLAAVSWSAPFVAVPLAVCVGFVGWAGLRATAVTPDPELVAIALACDPTEPGMFEPHR